MAMKRTASNVSSVRNAPNSGSFHWDAVYEKTVSEIPWEIEQPPAPLVELLDSGRLKAGSNALDVACGSGNYSVYLAQKGVRVTGLDFSKKALALAKKKVQNAGLEKRVHLVHADVRDLFDVFPRKRFDFILDWSLLHHIPPADFEAYATQFSRLLEPGGVLLLACFSDADAPKPGVKEAVGKLGNVMYYRTREEIEAAYAPLTVWDYRMCRLGKKGKHAGHCFLLQKPPVEEK